MKLDDLVVVLDQVLSIHLAEEGDPCGLLIGHHHNEIRHMRTALEVTNKVIEEAIKDQVDLLVVHHPLIYTPLTTLTDREGIGQKVMALVEHQIALYVAHSNLDRMERGLNQCFGEMIGFQSMAVCVHNQEGYVLKSTLTTPIPLEEYARVIGQKLDEPHLKFFGDGKKLIKKVGYCTGSGMGLLNHQIFDEVDVYLTGDMKYHDIRELTEMGFCLIDVTHYGSEKIAGEVLFNLLNQGDFRSLMLTKDTGNHNPTK